MQDEALAQGEAKLLAQHIQAKFMHPIEQLLMPDYPLRCPPAAEAAEPAATFKLDEVSVSLKVRYTSKCNMPEDACACHRVHVCCCEQYMLCQLKQVCRLRTPIGKTAMLPFSVAFAQYMLLVTVTQLLLLSAH